MSPSVCARRITIFALIGVASCEPSNRAQSPSPQTHRNEARYGLTFEERMALPPLLTRLHADVVKRAKEIYDPFRSRDDAIRHEEFVTREYSAAVDKVLFEKHLTREQLDEITREYQVSLGGNLR